MAQSHDIFDEALALPEAERARLAAKLIDSLDPRREKDVDGQWRAEIARRIAQLDRGDVQSMDWLDARRQILE